jgi:Serine endopeptidase inhibitors
MSDKNSQNSNPIPFFARFLEEQFGAELSEAEMASVTGGVGQIDDNLETHYLPKETDKKLVTLKYPSDVDGDTGYGYPGSGMIPKMPSMPEFPKFPSFPDYKK